MHFDLKTGNTTESEISVKTLLTSSEFIPATNYNTTMILHACAKTVICPIGLFFIMMNTVAHSFNYFLLCIPIIRLQIIRKSVIGSNIHIEVNEFD